MEDNLSDKTFDDIGEKIFQLSTGALALSITFRTSIAPSDAVHKWVLSAAWISLTISVVYYVCFRAHWAMFKMKSADIVRDFKRRVESEEKIDEMPDVAALTKKETRYTLICWVITFVGFLAGMALLLIFALLNNR